MTGERLDDVLAIEALTHHVPWTRGNFEDSLKSGHMAILMQDDETLLGYAVLMPLPDESELLNITIAPSQQRRGLGRQLLEHVCKDARSAGAQRMHLEVRASNLPARTLYEHNGFVEIGLRKNYYALDGGQRENAILMARELQANDQ